MRNQPSERRARAVPRLMRAVVYRGPKDLRVEELPVPRIRAGELLVKVAVCGVCPTDIKKIQYGTVSPPRIFGHETAGTIVRVGAAARGFHVGERVAMHHHVPCLECHACSHRAFAQCAQYKRTGITAGFEPAGGGYAEYVRVMPFVLPGVVKIPARNSFAEGAMLEPVNTVLKAVRRLSLLRGDTVLVAGQGPIGLMFTRLLALEGMQVIVTDLFPERLRLALGFGAAQAYRVFVDDCGFVEEQTGRAGCQQRRRPAARTLDERVFNITGGRGLDAAVIAVPLDSAVLQAQSMVRGAGQILLFSHTRGGTTTPLDLAKVCVEEKDLIGSYSSDFLLQDAVAKLVFSRKMDVRPLISHRLPLDMTAEAVQLAASPSGSSLKVLVEQAPGSAAAR